MNLILSILAAVLLSVANIGCGYYLWKLVVRGDKIINKSILYFLGFALYSNIFVILSIIFRYPFNLILLGPFLVLAFFKGISLMSNHIYWQRFKISQINITHGAVFVLLGSALLILFLHSLIPNTGWDEVVYRLPVIREIASGDVKFPLLQSSHYQYFYRPFSTFYGNFSYGSESFAAVAYLLGGGSDAAVSLLYYTNYIFLCLFLFWLLLKHFKLSLLSALIGVLMLTLSKSFSLLISTVYIDINVAIYEFLALFMLLYSFDKKNVKFGYVSAVFLGFGLALKLSVLYFLPIYVIVFVVKLLENRGFRIRPTSFLNFSLYTLLFGSFWYIKNTIIFNNPIFPLVFGGKGLSAEDLSFINKTQTEPRVSRTLDGLFMLLKGNYEYILIILVGMLFCFMLFKLRVTRKPNMVFYFTFVSISLFLINYLFGNQSPRYILLSNLLVYLVIPVVLKFRPKLFFLLAVLAVVNVIFNRELKGVWLSRIRNIYHIAINNDARYYQNNIGCSYQIVDFLEAGNNKSNTLNFWDPYAAVYFQDEDVFSYLPGKVKYVYINNQYKGEFLINKTFHSDMNIDNRVEIEKKLIDNKKPVVQIGNCYLYEL